MIEIPYEYIFIRMFDSLIRYGNKRSVTDEEVCDYVSTYLELSEEFAHELGKEEVEFNEYDPLITLDAFISQNSNAFYEENGTYYINDDVNLEALNLAVAICNDSDEIPDLFKIDEEDIDLLETIGATYIIEEVKKMYKLELLYEKAYINYITNPNDKNLKSLKKYFLAKHINLENIRNLPEYFVDGIYYVGRDYLDEIGCAYDKLPVDKELWDAMPHVGPIDAPNVLYETHQYAIFGKDSLAAAHLREDLHKIFVEKDSSLQDKMFDFLHKGVLEEELYQVIYLRYIANIDEYFKKYGYDADLAKVKARLMYLLDNNQLFLYDEDNLDKVKNTVSKVSFNPLDIFVLADEAIFLTGELFIVDKPTHTKEKLLLMKTYYDLTQDKNITELFDTFKEIPVYDGYNEVLFGKSKTLKRDKNNNNNNNSVK